MNKTQNFDSFTVNLVKGLIIATKSTKDGRVFIDSPLMQTQGKPININDSTILKRLNVGERYTFIGILSEKKNEIDFHCKKIIDTTTKKTVYRNKI